MFTLPTLALAVLFVLNVNASTGDKGPTKGTHTTKARPTTHMVADATALGSRPLLVTTAHLGTNRTDASVAAAHAIQVRLDALGPHALISAAEVTKAIWVADAMLRVEESGTYEELVYAQLLATTAGLGQAAASSANGAANATVAEIGAVIDHVRPKVTAALDAGTAGRLFLADERMALAMESLDRAMPAKGRLALAISRARLARARLEARAGLKGASDLVSATGAQLAAEGKTRIDAPFGSSAVSIATTLGETNKQQTDTWGALYDAARREVPTAVGTEAPMEAPNSLLHRVERVSLLPISLNAEQMLKASFNPGLTGVASRLTALAELGSSGTLSTDAVLNFARSMTRDLLDKRVGEELESAKLLLTYAMTAVSSTVSLKPLTGADAVAKKRAADLIVNSPLHDVTVAAGTVQALAVFFPADMRRQVTVATTFVTAGVQTVNAVKGILTALSSGGAGAGLAKLGAAFASGNLLGAATAIFGMFGGPSIDEQTLEAVQRLSKTVATMRKEIHQGFARVDSTLLAMNVKLDKEFDKLNENIAAVSQQATSIQQSVRDLSGQLAQTETHIVDLLEIGLQNQRDAEVPRLNCVLANQFNSQIPALQLTDCLNHLVSRASDYQPAVEGPGILNAAALRALASPDSSAGTQARVLMAFAKTVPPALAKPLPNGRAFPFGFSVDAQSYLYMHQTLGTRIDSLLPRGDTDSRFERMVDAGDSAIAMLGHLVLRPSAKTVGRGDSALFGYALTQVSKASSRHRLILDSISREHHDLLYKALDSVRITQAEVAADYEVLPNGELHGTKSRRVPLPPELETHIPLELRRAAYYGYGMFRIRLTPERDRSPRNETYRECAQTHGKSEGEGCGGYKTYHRHIDRMQAFLELSYQRRGDATAYPIFSAHFKSPHAHHTTQCGTGETCKISAGQHADLIVGKWHDPSDKLLERLRDSVKTGRFLIAQPAVLQKARAALHARVDSLGRLADLQVAIGSWFEKDPTGDYVDTRTDPRWAGTDQTLAEARGYPIGFVRVALPTTLSVSDPLRRVVFGADRLLDLSVLRRLVADSTPALFATRDTSGKHLGEIVDSIAQARIALSRRVIGPLIHSLTPATLELDPTTGAFLAILRGCQFILKHGGTVVGCLQYRPAALLDWPSPTTPPPPSEPTKRRSSTSRPFRSPRIAVPTR